MKISMPASMTLAETAAAPALGARFAALELGLVNPHAVHDDGELAGERDFGTAPADALGKCQAPGF